jgi:hypothetical protein
MNEMEWLSCPHSHSMLAFVRGKVSERKLRLLACACCRALGDTITPDKVHEVIDVAERYADGEVRGDERKNAWKWAWRCATESGELSWEVGGGWQVALDVHAWATRIATVALAPPGEVTHTIDAVWPWHWPQPLPCAALAYDIFGNPFRSATLDAAWITPTVTALALAAYAERALPSGTLDTVRLGILADALEEAGCDNQTVFDHLRGPGPHIRGCWCVDRLLAKE